MILTTLKWNKLIEELQSMTSSKKHQEMTRCSKANENKSTTITKRFMVTIKELSKTLFTRI
jgi:adenylosuccinate lyase